MRRSADDILNGEVLAQPNSDIGHFSVGNPCNGEKPLIVWVYRYTNKMPSDTHNVLLAAIMADASTSMITRAPVVENDSVKYFVTSCRGIHVTIFQLIVLGGVQGIASWCECCRTSVAMPKSMLCS